MKPLLLLSFFFLSIAADATNYFISSSSGNDANPGTSPGSSWKTLAKLSSSFNSFGAGDSVLFKRGDVFYGSINMGKGHSSALPITFGAYGTGSNPVITGFTTVKEWTNTGNNIWESTSAVSALPVMNMVVVNGENTPMGRYPNEGFLSYQGFTTSSITSSSLNSDGNNWTGAIAVIKKHNWIIDRDTITQQSGNAITHTTHSMYKGIKDYGFFIQNDSRTLDKQNEWYYNPSTKKLKIYSNGSPGNVQVPTIDNLVSMNGTDNITFTNISFTGSNKAAFAVTFSQQLQIFNCRIDFSGVNAIITRGGRCGSFKLINSTINHTNNNAIDLGGASPNCLLSHDIIKNTGLFAGMGADADRSYTAVQTNSDNGIVENCIIDSTGYIGIGFYGNNTMIRNNTISDFCLTKFDGGAIYTFIKTGDAPFTGEQLLNNVIRGGNGNTAGTTQSVPLIHGIYLDEGTANVEVAGNVITNCTYSGLYIHNAHDINIHNNTCFNNGRFQGFFVSANPSMPIKNIIIKSNLFISKTSTQKAAGFQSKTSDITSFGAVADIDSNSYARPIDDNKTIETTNGSAMASQKTLAEWQAYSGFDANSCKSPLTIRDVNDLRFESNEKGTDKIITLDKDYIDIVNKPHSGTVTLTPYSSVILIKNGTRVSK